MSDEKEPRERWRDLVMDARDADGRYHYRGQERFLVDTMGRYMDADTLEFFLSEKRAAWHLGTSESYVRGIKRKLLADGVIEKVRRGSGNRHGGRATTFRGLIPNWLEPVDSEPVVDLEPVEEEIPAENPLPVDSEPVVGLEPVETDSRTGSSEVYNRSTIGGLGSFNDRKGVETTTVVSSPALGAGAPAPEPETPDGDAEPIEHPCADRSCPNTTVHERDSATWLCVDCRPKADARLAELGIAAGKMATHNLVIALGSVGSMAELAACSWCRSFLAGNDREVAAKDRKGRCPRCIPPESNLAL